MTIPERVATLCGKRDCDLTISELMLVRTYYVDRSFKHLPNSDTHNRLKAAIDWLDDVLSRHTTFADSVSSF